MSSPDRLDLVRLERRLSQRIRAAQWQVIANVQTSLAGVAALVGGVAWASGHTDVAIVCAGAAALSLVNSFVCWRWGDRELSNLIADLDREATS